MTLNGVNFADNNLGDQGIEWLSDCIDGYQFDIRYMNLSENKITDKGSKKFTDMLRANKTVQCIDLRHNNLSERTAKAFRVVAKANPMLTKVHLEYNLCNIKQLEEINEICDQNKKRQESKNLTTIRKQARNLKKDVKKVGLNKNDQDEAFKELDE